MFSDIPINLISQLNGTLTQAGNTLEMFVTELQKVYNDMEEAASLAVLTPTGYIQMPQPLDQQFVYIAGSIVNTTNVISSEFKILAANVQAVQTAVDAGKKQAGNLY